MNIEKQRKKIIFAGMPDMALVCLNKLAKEGFQIAGVIPPHKSTQSSSLLKKFAHTLGLEVFEFEKSPNEPAFVERIGALGCDIGVICSYDKLFSKDFLKTTKRGYINCHPSFLPHYRGANPYHHIILNGETKTGITLHFADETFDTGDIILQKEIPITPQETMGTLFNNSNYVFAQCLCDVLKEYEKTGKIERRAQPKGDFIKAPKVNSEIILDFNQQTQQLDRLIRACNPFYSCSTFFRGTSMRIISADFTLEKHVLRPSQVVNHLGRFAITAKDGYIYPKVVLIGSWGIFDTAEFIQKFNPQEGEKIGL